ncbi:hypothetical protein OEZ85_005253 [Tetradesmus obliquus]|uniref:Anaphase-promoting complex subunit 4 WD40 domain-containing protein n=1 Tax=Tetradesmus obliquus TaxID=3088 RepID=A0ABY8UHR0_TETOB|nr:hypothetical protein OEZ85_005253 [Tetradesmus obliquus]
MPPTGTALQRLKDARIARQQAGLTGRRQHFAASSDADNEAYMQHFEAAFSSLSTAPPAEATVAEREFKTALPGWRVGPVDAAGVLVQLSDRPLLCSAANWGSNEVIIGSSDHASYVVDAAAGKKRRTLYSKTTGHTEWVTSVCCLPGGRVLSGGMDGRLWLWPAGGSAGTEVSAAHSAPVSKVACLTPAAARIAAAGGSSSSRSNVGVRAARAAAAAAAAGPVLAVSCSYDKVVQVWDVSGSRAKQQAVLQGHTGPVLEMAVHPAGTCIATGDRKGGLMCWDLDTGSSSWGVAAAHQGHITALAWSAAAANTPEQHLGCSSSSCFVISGGQDKVVRVWDGRTGSCSAEQTVHADKKGKGAVGNIVTGLGSSGNLVVTAGADMTLRVLDAAQSYKPIHTVQLTDFPYSLTAAASDLVLCGCGDGSVHVVDVEAGAVLYALGAGRAAVRAMEVSPGTERLVCAGDDGCVVCYEFQ